MADARFPEDISSRHPNDVAKRWTDRWGIGRLRRMSVIKFGASGWRGIISDTFTFANVELAAHAISQLLNENPPAGAAKRLIIGHDTRFLSREFATRGAE